MTEQRVEAQKQVGTKSKEGTVRQNNVKIRLRPIYERSKKGKELHYHV